MTTAAANGNASGRGRSKLALVLAALALAAPAAAGCAVGDGSGEASGSMEILGCRTENGRLADFIAPSYDFGPTFFVGEPVDADRRPNRPPLPNLILIRIQNSGVRLEFADALLFSLLDTYEVGRCMRGRVNPDGSPDWNPDLCDRETGPEGRVLIGTEREIGRAFMMLNRRCPAAFTSASALGDCAAGTCPPTECTDRRGSWISFSQFGSVPQDPAVPLPADFKVNYGEQLTASAFHLEMCDAATILAYTEQPRVPAPLPRMSVVLDGNFEFDLQRGQAGQPFP
jgi:hypothetical protein